MSNPDINPAAVRAWAREQGIDVSDRGRVPDALLERYAARIEDDDEPMVVGLTAVPDPTEPSAASSAEATPTILPGPPTRRAETPPQGRRQPLFKRKPRSPASKTAKRVSIESVVSWGWGLGAMAVAQAGAQAMPVARVLDMQAPAAGIIVDDLARGTVLDRILQPLARGGETAEKVLGLLGPPVIVGAITANPALYEPLKGILKISMMQWMAISKPAMVKAQKRAEEFTETMGGVDLDALIEALFADVATEGVPSSQEEANIRRARGDG